MCEDSYQSLSAEFFVLSLVDLRPVYMLGLPDFFIIKTEVGLA